jgi:hypothetical protein
MGFFSKVWSVIKSAATRTYNAVASVFRGTVGGTVGLLVGVGGGVGCALAIAPASVAGFINGGASDGVAALATTVGGTIGFPLVGAVALLLSVLAGVVDAGSHAIRGVGLGLESRAVEWMRQQFPQQFPQPRRAAAAAR